MNKKIIILILILAVCFLGCKKKSDVSFCEGLSPKGEPVKCGKKFTTGKLFCLVKKSKLGDVTSFKVTVYQQSGSKKIPVDHQIIEVKEEDKFLKVPLILLAEGKYIVEVKTMEDVLKFEETVSMEDAVLLEQE